MAAKKTTAVKRSSDVFRLKLPADSANLDLIRKFVSGIAIGMGFDEEEIYQIELAVDEACANVINHAYREKPEAEKLINITVRKKPKKLEIVIADKGVGFDPSELTSPDMNEYLKRMKPGGLGVHLFRTLMDEVQFSIRPGVRNAVKMVKYLS